MIKKEKMQWRCGCGDYSLKSVRWKGKQYEIVTKEICKQIKSIETIQRWWIKPFGHITTYRKYSKVKFLIRKEKEDFKGIW